MLASPRTAPIVCIGGINLDRKLRPLATLLHGSSNPCVAHESPGGVARNLAENLARLGRPVALVGAVGQDLTGRVLLEQAQACGVDTAAVLRLRGAVTDSYTALLTPDGTLDLGLAAMPLVERLSAAALPPSQALRAGAALVVADGNLPSDTLATLIEAGQHGAPLVFVAVSEAKMARLPTDLRGLHLMILNRGELATVAPDPQEALAALHARGAQRVIVTDGAKGVWLSEGSGSTRTLAARALAEVVDVTGAGDALAAGVCLGLARAPHDLDAAARLGLALAHLTLQSTHSVHPDLSPDFLESAP
jgi:pseudouridine kinase